MNEWPLIGARFPYLPVRVRIRHDVLETEALLDTGFDGDIVLPLGSVSAIVAVDTTFRWRLADGTWVEAPGYRGSVELGPVRLRPVLITALGDTALIGRRLIQHFRVTMDHGERVIVGP